MREELIQTALGNRTPELVLKNARIVNVFTGEILPGDIAISCGMIAGIGTYDNGQQVTDLQGRYVAPGFIDAHVHVESSMVVPAVYCMEAVKWGTTTLITDPHEIANVSGVDGIRFMLDSAADAPVNYFVQIPSCVPATPFEHAGATILAHDMEPFLDDLRISGLGEMMNYPGVASCDESVMEKLHLFSKGVIDGHAPGLSGRDLQAYAAAGIETDHESTTYEEAREKLRAGMAVLVREGSACHNLRSILDGVLRDGLDTRRMAFCTDDKHLSDVCREGTIRHCIRLAISAGMKPIEAIQIATINAARIYRLRDIGAVAPGYRADLAVLDDLEEVTVHAVYKDGGLVSSNDMDVSGSSPIASRILHSVHTAPLPEGGFPLPDSGMLPVINLVRGQVTTKKSEIPAEQAPGLIVAGRLRKLAVIERHHATGNTGVGLIAGYGLAHGAIATTVAHDSHNMIVAGDNDLDMLLAVRELERVNGGYTLVINGQVMGTLPLPVAGLMSTLSAEEFIPALDDLLERAHCAGIAEGIDPFLTLSFVALPVIPEIRLTDMGMFDVTRFQFLK